MGLGLANTYIQQNSLPLQLVRISIRDILGISNIPFDILGLVNGEFKIVIHKSGQVTPPIMKTLVLAGHHHFFVHKDDISSIISLQTQKLLSNTRTLSIGDSFNKSVNQLNLLSVNFRYLYNNPSSDDLLKTQLQTIKTFSKFLINNHKLIGPLVKRYIKCGHHYLLSQPMISSVFVVGILKRSNLFSDKEIENLFITSYFKDIGMTTIPENLLSKISLNSDDKKIFMLHSGQSEKILSGRLGVTNTYMEVIKNHHSHSFLTKNQTSEKIIIDGFETVIITVTDIISAMISERPYRTSTPLFDALLLIKPLMSDNYSHEYRWIVNYFKNLFSNK